MNQLATVAEVIAVSASLNVNTIRIAPEPSSTNGVKSTPDEVRSQPAAAGLSGVRVIDPATAAFTKIHEPGAIAIDAGTLT